MVAIYKEKATCFNIGDSRAILIRSKDGKDFWEVVPLSIDQTPARKDERERIIKNGGKVECCKDEKGMDVGPLRVWMRNLQMPGLAMTRSFGDTVGLKAGTSSSPEIMEHILSSVDKYLVIASDGIWEYMSNDDIKQILQNNKQNLNLAADKIITTAIDKWNKFSIGRDDITLVLLPLQY